MSIVDVSIIIVNYRTPRLTINCVESLFKFVKSVFYEIIIVDNCSGDDSLNLIAQMLGDKVTVIPSPVNLGFGRANNLGVKYATGQYLFFLNSDTVVKNDPFEYFIPFYQVNEKVGALGAFLVDGLGSSSLSGGSSYTAQKYLKFALNGILRQKIPAELQPTDKPVEVDYIIGADLFMRKDTFVSVNGFNPKIFMYFEDVELCEKIRNQDKHNYVIPGPEIVHFVKSSSSSQFSRVYNTASLMYCLRNKMKLFPFRMFQFAYFLLKSPLLLNVKNFKNECEYVWAIYTYKNYLVK